jgi:hypothetical protein
MMPVSIATGESVNSPAIQELAHATATPGQSGKKWRRASILVWLLQLVFPTIGLAHVVIWLLDPFPLGRFGVLLLGGCALWFGGCFLSLALPSSRGWIAAHPLFIATVFVILLVSLGSAELVCRNLPPVAYDPRVPHITTLSSELGWRLKPGAGDIGPHGWRRPEYPPAKSPKRFRIVCIGDSTTFGVGCSWRDAWPHQLEALLNQDRDWSRAHGITEVLNLGVLMYGPDQALLALRNDGISFAPDLVIFHLCSDDYADASFDYYWKMNFGKKMYKPSFVLEDGRLKVGRDRALLPTDASGNPVVAAHQILPDLQLSLFSFLRTRGLKVLSPGARRVEPVPTNAHWPIHDAFRAEYRSARPLVWALIKEMSRASSEAGAGFLLTLSPHHMNSSVDSPPWRVSSYLEEFREDARSAGITAFDCVKDYFAAGGNDRFQLDWDANYLNSAGNAMIAQATMRRIKQDHSMSVLGEER